MNNHAVEIAHGRRFHFGENWARFLRDLDDSRIKAAESALLSTLELKTLEGMRFLDVGCGSGLSSLAARLLGAKVHSFDFDPQSVACTRELKHRYFKSDDSWKIEEGSVLDDAYLASLGKFEIVYSWGVLHHTGAMWRALENVARLVSSEGTLYIAIYNDQGRPSKHWGVIKKWYNAAPKLLREAIVCVALVRLWGPSTIRDLMSFTPFRTWRQYKDDRGMSPWRDVVDWVGGYPFEVAKPEEIFDFYRKRDFELTKIKTCAGGLGCNEYVFCRRGASMSDV